jgi:phosphoserine phosphatase
LKTYNINIEFSDMIAREQVFLMELMVDIRDCAIPLQNLLGVLRDTMGAQGISSMFQSEDVFNKKKRILLFDIRSSFIDLGTLNEILKLVGISAKEFNAAYRHCEAATALQRAANCLDGLPVEVARKVAESIEVSAGTLELIQTLKIMGYRIALLSRGFSCVSDIMKNKLGIDHCFGVSLLENDDAMTMTGELDEGALESLERAAVIERLMRDESVAREDITVIADEENDPGAALPGLRVRFDMKVLLDYYNQHILSREALIGILGGFGVPALPESEQ